MSEADYIKLARAYRAGTVRIERTVLALFRHGQTHAPISIDFCAADFCVVFS
jgi:hypothetical protein